MRRREFIALVGGAAAWPLAARGQQPGRMRLIGVLLFYGANNSVGLTHVAALRQGLQELGWTEGRNLIIELRWTGGDPDRARTLATELLQLSPDAILSASTANLTALLRQAPAVPIVFVQVFDPVAQGFVVNLARPGGNITGFYSFESSIAGKWIDLLKQIMPGLARVVVVFNPDTALQSKFLFSSLGTIGISLGVELTAAPVHELAEIERTIARFAGQANFSIVFPNDTFTDIYRDPIVELAKRYRVPAIYSAGEFAAAGGLMSYGYDRTTTYKQAATYIDRILNGAKPGDLPVQGPTKFTLAINLTAAMALGLTIPPSLFALADEVIQ